MKQAEQQTCGPDGAIRYLTQTPEGIIFSMPPTEKERLTNAFNVPVVYVETPEIKAICVHTDRTTQVVEGEAAKKLKKKIADNPRFVSFDEDKGDPVDTQKLAVNVDAIHFMQTSQTALLLYAKPQGGKPSAMVCPETTADSVIAAMSNANIPFREVTKGFYLINQQKDRAPKGPKSPGR